jgi:hypothetical protein
MTVKILYKKILNLEFWHDYDLGQPNPPQPLPARYNIGDVLTLIPTSDCVRILKNLRWVFRPQPEGAAIFADVHEGTAANTFQTTIQITQPYRLTFWLLVRDRYFTNFTNLPLTSSQNQIYYFSNLSGNQGHALFLTQPLALYEKDETYSLGQLVTYQDNTLEAIRYPISASDTPNTTDDWAILPGSQYVSARDRLPQRTVFGQRWTAAANPGDTFRFALVDMNAQEVFVSEAIAPDTHPPGQMFTVHLNFAGLPPGRYELSVNGASIDEFVLKDGAAPPNTFALVEIFLNPDLVPPAFSLLQPNSGQTLIQPKTYVIRFKNRATYWRYRYAQPHQATEQDPPPDHFFVINPAFKVIDQNTYVTKQPVGLRRQLDQLLNDNHKPLPIPSVTLIEPELDASHHIAKIFSNIHL